MATDIAFALGVLALLGDRIPASARIFLLALATVDDIGAILVIAIFYSHQLSYMALAGALALIGLMIVMRKIGIQTVAYYIPVGVLLWFAVLESGIHATIAGVVLGVLTPTDPYFGKSDFAESAEPLLQKIRHTIDDSDTERTEAMLGELEQLTVATEAPADRLVRILHPWSSYVVLPVFALANAGVRLTPTLIAHAVSSHVTLGVVLGLILGKVVGITLFAYLAVRLGIANPIPNVRGVQLAGIGLLAGIGFTVSLFITDLAFADPAAVTEARLGVLSASLLAGAAGYFLLRTTAPRSAG